jgi:hypothetical protein
MRKRMNRKSWIVLFGVAIFLCLGVLSYGEKGPKIVFKDESFDFGKIKQGDVVSHKFVFKNEGNAPLKINKVTSSCGCTAALVSQKKVAPGGKGEIKATLNSRGYRGNLTKYIYVESNDTNQPTIRLTIKVMIEVPPSPKISLDRYSSDLGLYLEGEKIKTTRSIANKGELELQVSCSHKEATFFSQGKEVTFPLKIPSGKSVELEVRMPPKKRQGLVREYILIHSNDPNRRSLSFFLSGYIVTKKQLKELFAKYKEVLD